MMESDSCTKLPPGIDCEDIIAFGTTGLIVRYPDHLRVAKIPHGGDSDARDRSSIESEIYQHFNQLRNRPSSILQYFETSNGTIILEFAENGDVRRFLRKRKAPLEYMMILLQWAQQAAQSLAFCHSQNVLHGDINCGNFCLDRHLNIKLCDFAGSSINGSSAKVCYSTSHQLPGNQPSTSDGIMISEKTEIFAFGSALYEMVTGDEPYSEKDDSEIEELYRHNIFPDVTGLGPLGPVITRCWTSDFHHMSEVVECIEAKIRSRRRQNTLALSFAFALIISVFHSVTR
ncbi:kinase-like domain-containing protein [Aspergillus coremiiformis]|uniref:Kinase-like domain-containing protein n=1 Tax=Aspergillus coremiiformis TaxID=138285 RepID=A0A5N6ZBS2_9EURO|nr:kinase-like domain-containing protein [Aspergillus coremiiformis]